VWAVLDYTDTNCIERELLLAKVSILGPEYVEDQYHGGPTQEPRRPDAKVEREAHLVANFERSGSPDLPAQTNVQDPHTPPPLTPSQLLRMKSEHLQSISTLAEQFGARIVDVSEHSIIVELSGKTSKVEAFLSLLKPFGLLESARTGTSV
jgi:acetolactate synthase I/III small subunit